MKQVVVTGGLGYIGRHVALALSNAGYYPLIIDSRVDMELERVIHRRLKGQCSFLTMNLLDPAERLNRAVLNSAAVIHLAGHKSVRQSIKDPVEYYRNNIGTLANVLDARMIENHWHKRIIFSSSATVYKAGESLTEEATLGATNPYGRTKLFCEELLQDAVFSTGETGNSRHLQAVSLRYFNPVFAECEEFEECVALPENLVPAIHNSLNLGMPVYVFGSDYDTRDGTAVRDYIHVMDVAEAHVAVLKMMEELPANESYYDVFNVGSGRGLTVLEMIKAYENHYKVEVPYTLEERRPGDVPVLYASTNKLQARTGWGVTRPFI
jgi:UDP-glucose 4-epimerase